MQFDNIRGDFQIGDRVLVVENERGYHTVGLAGTVASISGNIGVIHDQKFTGGHTLDGHCDNGYGLWYAHAASQLRHIEQVVEKINASAIDMLF